MRVKMHLLLMTLMLMIASVAGAQVTTSSVSGKIVADNENVIGATITAVHEPSGTKYNAVTNQQGRYAIQGMRSGGPYTITISYIGYNQEVFRNVNLALGQEEVINANLKEDARSLGEVVVNGQAGKAATVLQRISHSSRLKTLRPSTAIYMMWPSCLRWLRKTSSAALP